MYNNIHQKTAGRQDRQRVTDYS